MKLKLDAENHVVVQDGKPVYVHDDGKEVAFDAPMTIATISRLNGEAKGHREAKEAAESRLKAFEGIDDAEAARKALDTVKNLKEGDLVTAGKVQEIKEAAARAAKEQVEAAAKASGERIKELETNNSKLTGDLYKLQVGGSFKGSKFIADKIAVPADMVEAMFGNRFKVEDGKIVGYDAAGNKLYSRAKPGELADFDEALETIVDSYSHRESILKGTGNSGSGARDSNGGIGGGKTVSRKEFEAMDPASRAKSMADGVKLVD